MSDPFANLDKKKYRPKSAAELDALPVDPALVEKVAAENNFPSRHPPAPKVVTSQGRAPQHVFRTGRSKQINIKGTKECDDHLERLRVELDAPKGVVLQEALNALEAVKAEVIQRLQQARNR
jgi:hypothetical protein